MTNFEIYGLHRRLYQWDINRRLSVEVECDQVHFANRGVVNALVCEVYEDGDKRVVDVPNVLLQTAGVLKVFAYVCNGDESYTKVSATFNVISRPKPEDYVYTETEVLNYKNLDSRVKALEQGGASAGDIAKAVDEALAQAKVNGEFDGEDGYTPVKGVDYFTDDDKQEIAGMVQVPSDDHINDLINTALGVIENGAY